MQRLVKHWNGLLKGVVKSPSLEVLKSHRNVVLRDMAWWWLGSSGSVVGLNVLRGVF